MGGDQRSGVHLISVQEDVASVSEKRLHLAFLSIPRRDIIDLHCPIKAWRRAQKRGVTPHPPLSWTTSCHKTLGGHPRRKLHLHQWGCLREHLRIPITQPGYISQLGLRGMHCVCACMSACVRVQVRVSVSVCAHGHEYICVSVYVEVSEVNLKYHFSGIFHRGFCHRVLHWPGTHQFG